VQYFFFAGVQACWYFENNSHNEQVHRGRFY
jgi:hypothetical protein